MTVEVTVRVSDLVEFDELEELAALEDEELAAWLLAGGIFSSVTFTMAGITLFLPQL